MILSLSQRIEAEGSVYYGALKQPSDFQRGHAVAGILPPVPDAQRDAERRIKFTPKEAQLFDRFSGKINDRQTKVLARIFAAGPDRFDSGMSAEK